MRRIYLLLLVMMSLPFGISAQDDADTTTIDSAQAMEMMREILSHYDTAFTFQTGVIDLGDGLATLTVPEGFKYLDPEQSNTVLVDLWGNPPTPTLGLLFPEKARVLGDDFSYAVEISYSEEGYIEDEDAEDIDYDELLKEMQDDARIASEQRVEEGYASVELIGWASPPYYDADNKKLHWAQEYRFGESDVNTLNYNIRVLGRKGYLMLNAIGDIAILPQVKNDIQPIIASVSFQEGNTYFDFDPEVDEVAAYGIGGLIAGKVLAKAGFFALLLKFWKVIAAAVVGAFALLRKKIFPGSDA